MADCECESSPQSEHEGPGVVEDAETLLRLVFLPEQIDDFGGIKPTSIDTQDLRLASTSSKPDRGFSVFRHSYTSPDALNRQAADFQARKPDSRESVEVFTAKVEDVRSLMEGANRMVCVVDQSLPNDPSHAECWGAHPRKPSQLKQVRVALAASFKRGWRVG